MPEPAAEIAILVVNTNNGDVVEDCLASVVASTEPGIRRRVVLVDNASTDGSPERVARRFGEVDIVRSAGNRGFTGANNLGWAFIRRRYPDVDYLVLLNPDTEVAGGWLGALAGFLDARPDVACAQPKLMLHPETELLNTAGNRSHYLGFGQTSEYRRPDRGRHTGPEPIGYPSGAAVMIRADLVRRYGLLDGGLFLYHDDLELGWRYRQLGLASYLVPDATVYHKYNFSKNYRYYYYFERNRLRVMLVYYKAATLLLLLPALAAMELAQLAFAAVHGVARQKLRSWAYFLDRRNLRELRCRRRRFQRRRRVSDRAFMRDFVGALDFPEIATPLLTYVGNPLMRAYWTAARRLMFW